MAERIQVELVDDIDGSRAEHTVTVALDGVIYEIDLNDQHARQLRAVLAPYIERARPAKQQVRTTRQQQREDHRARRTNRRLTEQIRGAAQRSRQLHKQELEHDRSTAGHEQHEQVPGQFEQDRMAWFDQAPFGSADGAPAEDSSDTDEERAQAPVVSLPRFSSASE